LCYGSDKQNFQETESAQYPPQTCNKQLALYETVGLILIEILVFSSNIILILQVPFLVKEMFAIAKSERRNVTTGNIGGHQYTKRIELLPFGRFASKGDYKENDLNFEPKPKLALGFPCDFNSNAAKTRSK
jgi:hypothetical protein